MFCPKCQSEFRSGFTRCNECDVALVDQLPQELRAVIDHSEPVIAETYANELDAAVAKTALDAAGIESMFRGDDSGHEAPSMDLSRGIQILVTPADLEDARAVLNSEFRDDSDEDNGAV